MNNLLEVREFDSIIGNEDFQNYGNYKYIGSEEAFNSLINFIHEYTGDDDSTDISQFMRISHKSNIGFVVTIRNYVGLIQMKNDFQVQVLPKIDFGEDEENIAQTKKVFLNMLKSMKDFPGKAFNNASLMTDKMSIYDVFIYMYLQEVDRLVKRGIHSNYVEQTDNLRYYKGKLLVNQHIRMNLAHRERFYVQYEEFHPNAPENRLVKATLKKLQTLTRSAINVKLIRQLLAAFELVDSSTNYEKDFSKVVINRNNEEYETLMQWSKIFLMNKSFTTFSGYADARALLFPMETVYESYVAQQMKRVFCPDGWDVSSQDRRYYLFVEPKKQFALKPDIVIKKDDRTIVLDTKWKRLYNNERKNYGISQSDMYQMYAYSKKYKTPEIWLLYPVNKEMRNHDQITFNSGDDTTVRLFFVDVAQINSSLHELKRKISEM